MMRVRVRSQICRRWFPSAAAEPAAAQSELAGRSGSVVWRGPRPIDNLQHHNRFVVESVDVALKLRDLIQNSRSYFGGRFVLVLANHLHQQLIAKHLAGSVLRIWDAIAEEDD